MEEIITTAPDIMHGTPCFAGTRVDVKTFFDHIKEGYSVDEFLEQFPSVRPELVSRFLDSLQDDATRAAVRA